ncbi:MAG: DNA topoisomerase III [Pseudomonadales bacterium]|nr:DNA topoisomerase III [Pseudomonadales bacterium]NRA14144.1 DNA topoisomerase III [Oceanospirillaceae bacterium]
MILYIAEKPSLGRAIADALPKPHKKQPGYIEVGNGDIVSWCIGHLLEQAEPDAYDPKYKQWKLEHLPIVPQQWQLKAKKDTAKQLSVLRALLKRADSIVHAGDPDREGQLLVDEVLAHLKVGVRKRSSAQRCLISDLNLAAVRRSLGNLRSNSEFIPLSTSALARSRADWLYGMNMTRLCTIHGGSAGFQGVLSVGRVQTPLLGLVVRRDLEIANFQPRAFYEVWAQLKTAAGEDFKLKWKPSASCAPYQDEEGRVLNRALAENVARRIKGQLGKVLRAQTKAKKQPPPLPYNLSTLQIDAAKAFAFSAKKVLDTCQSLYERHKLITYPRSDSRYLPVEHFAQGSSVGVAIGAVDQQLAQAVANADFSRKSKAWNDAKVDAHHAIIPTQKSRATGSLSRDEGLIYQLIARSYLYQFYPAYSFDERQLEVEIAGGLFTGKSVQATDQGWKALQPKSKKSQNNSEQQRLPSLKVTDVVSCIDAGISDKMTSAPAFFTDATLLAAMTGINRFVQDVELKKILKDTDGIGTEATRAGIIELLFKREFLAREGKLIKSTTIGQKLIGSLPDMATTPDMTALWESRLSMIAQRQFNYQQFMHDLQQVIQQLSQAVDPRSFIGLKGEGKKFTFKKNSRRTSKKSTKTKRSA